MQLGLFEVVLSLFVCYGSIESKTQTQNEFAKLRIFFQCYHIVRYESQTHQRKRQQAVKLHQLSWAASAQNAIPLVHTETAQNAVKRKVKGAFSLT